MEQIITKTFEVDMKPLYDFVKDKTLKEIIKECAKKYIHVNVYKERSAFSLNFTKKSDLNDPLTRLCTGAIFSKENDLLHFSFPKCYNYHKDDPYILNGEVVTLDNVPEESDNVTVSDYIDGVTIKYYYDNRLNDWSLASSTKIEAGQVVLSGTSLRQFFSTFYEGSEENFNNKLDTECTYVFVLQHPDILLPEHARNTLTERKLYMISKFDRKTNELEYYMYKNMNTEGKIVVTNNNVITLVSDEHKLIKDKILKNEDPLATFIKVKESPEQLMLLYRFYPEINVRFNKSLRALALMLLSMIEDFNIDENTPIFPGLLRTVENIYKVFLKKKLEISYYNIYNFLENTKPETLVVIFRAVNMISK